MMYGKDKFTIGSQWKTDYHSKAVVVEHFENAFAAYHIADRQVRFHNFDGAVVPMREETPDRRFDIIKSWVEPRTETVHFVVDDVGTQFIYTKRDSFAAAKEMVTDTTVAIVGPITWKEGQGL